MRKICIITGTRAEFGLLSHLMKIIDNDQQFELQVVVTGMHLSPEFGFTIEEIIDEGFSINKKIEILLSSDSSIGVSKSMGLAQISFAETLEELSPDLVIVLGDRFEIFAAVSSSMIMRIPVAHISGGELTLGAMDDSIRHCITKMSSIHFVGTEEYKKRVIQLGEHPSRVYNVGDVAIDGINCNNLMSRTEFERSINFKLNKNNIIVTFHPVTLEKGMATKQFKELLDAVDDLEDTHIIITHSNADMEGREIIKMIRNYVSKNSNKAIAFPSLGYHRYLSALQYMDAVVGNSSSGIVEAPSFKIGTINIGNRQKGRIQAPSIINCAPKKDSIQDALKKVYSQEFKEILKKNENPYGNGGSSQKIFDILKDISFEGLVHKDFYDL